MDIKTLVRFKKRKSMKENEKNKENDISIQIICLLKKVPPSSKGEKDFMVTSPARVIGKIKKTNIQSIRLRTFSAIILV